MDASYSRIVAHLGVADESDQILEAEWREVPGTPPELPAAAASWLPFDAPVADERSALAAAPLDLSAARRARARLSQAIALHDLDRSRRGLRRSVTPPQTSRHPTSTTSTPTAAALKTLTSLGASPLDRARAAQALALSRVSARER